MTTQSQIQLKHNFRRLKRCAAFTLKDRLKSDHTRYSNGQYDLTAYAIFATHMNLQQQTRHRYN